jgi:hypothetical protein
LAGVFLQGYRIIPFPSLINCHTSCFCLQPDTVSNNKFSTLKGKVDTGSAVPQKGNSHNMAPVDSSVVSQSNKFAGILSAVWETVYYEVMKDIWDGALYDPVMDYCDGWLQRNCQLNLPSMIISGTPDNIDSQDSDEMSPKVFSLLAQWIFFP